MLRLLMRLSVAALAAGAAGRDAMADPPAPFSNNDPFAPHVTDFSHGYVSSGLSGYGNGQWAPLTLTPDGRLRTDGGTSQTSQPTALVVPPGAVTTVGTTASTILTASSVTRSLWIGNPAPPGSGTLYCSPVATAMVGGANTFPIAPGGMIGFGPTDAGLANAWSCIASAGTLNITVLGY